MPRIRFTSDFDFKVNANVTRAYKAGHAYLVSQAAADEAIRRQRAIPVAPAPTAASRRTRKASNVGK